MLYNTDWSMDHDGELWAYVAAFNPKALAGIVGFIR